MSSPETNDWIFDYVLHFLKSTEWDAAVMGFIDNNCAIFVNDEENKFEYSRTHQAFVASVEKIIVGQLGKIGITVEQFVSACEKARHNRDINREVYEQMVAMDDFLTFKKLMVKRNVELGYEALQELQREQVPIVAPTTEAEAEVQFQRAMKESEDLSTDETANIIRVAKYNAQPPEEKNDGHIVDKELRAAIDQNLMEMELLHKKEEMEQLELEQAIAESLAIESQRISALTTQASETISQGECNENWGHDRLPGRKADEFGPVSTTAEAKIFPKEEGFAAREGTIEGLAKDHSISKHSRDDEKRETMSAAASSEVSLMGPEKKKSIGHKKCIVPHKAQPNPTPTPVSFTSIAELEEDMRKKRQAAEKTFRRNQDLLSEQRARERELQQQAGVTSQDIARREFQLKQQRDLILAKKNAEREERLHKALKENKKPAEGSQPSDDLSQKSDTGNKAIVTSSMRNEEFESDERRSMMRVALARRMKQELLESEEERLRKMQSEQFTELDRKLRLVEQLRDENRMKELQLADAIATQQTQRFKNIQLSAAKLSNNDEA